MGTPPVTVDLLEVPPPWALYLGPDDALQINIYTTSSTTGLELSLRTLTPDGAIHYETETLDGASTSTLTTKIFKLSEGFLLGLCISNLGGGLADQVCFVSAGLQFGTQTGLVQHTLLTQGYVTNVMSVAWPPTQPRGPAPSSGGGGLELPTVRGSYITAATASSFVLTLPVTALAGDLAVAFLTTQSNLSTQTGWTAINNAPGSQSYLEGQFGTKFLTPTDIVAGSVTLITQSSTAAVVGLVVLEGSDYLFYVEGNYHLNQTGTGDTTLNLPSSDAAILPTDLVLYWGSNRVNAGSSTNTVTDTLATVTLLQSSHTTPMSAGLYSGVPTVAGTLNPTFAFTSAGQGNYEQFGVFRNIG